MKFLILLATLPSLSGGFLLPSSSYRINNNAPTALRSPPNNHKIHQRSQLPHLKALEDGTNVDNIPINGTAQSKKVLVLGGDGFCGWPTSLYLSDRGHDVVIVDNLSRRNIDIELGCDSLTPIQSPAVSFASGVDAA